MTIRPAKVEDADAVAALGSLLFGAGVGAKVGDAIRNLGKSTGVLGEARVHSIHAGYWLLDHGDTIVGIVGLYSPRWIGSHNLYLGWFGVHPDLRRHGLGKQLLDYAGAEAGRLGARWLLVETSPEPSATVRFYQKAGFTPMATVPDYWEDGSSLLLMRRFVAQHNPSESVPTLFGNIPSVGLQGDDALATVRLLSSREDPLFWPALEFYVESFPRDEREALERVAEVASGNPKYCTGERRRIHMAVADVGGRLAGIRYFSYYAEAKLGFFIYLAVEPEFRRHGIGSMLVEFGKAICGQDAAEMGSSLDAIVFECERPELAESEQEREVRLNRLKYFHNRGAVIVTRDYYQPALGPDRSAVPLYLLAYPIISHPNWTKLVTAFHRNILGYAADSMEERRAVEAIELA